MFDWSSWHLKTKEQIKSQKMHVHMFEILFINVKCDCFVCFVLFNFYMHFSRTLYSNTIYYQCMSNTWVTPFHQQYHSRPIFMKENQLEIVESIFKGLLSLSILTGWKISTCVDIFVVTLHWLAKRII